MIDPTAAFDQLGATLRSFAPVVAGYYKALLEQDFTVEQAFALTRDYQQWFMRTMMGANAAPDAEGGEEG